MEVEYKVWEPDRGLEDIQAKIFSEASGVGYKFAWRRLLIALAKVYKKAGWANKQMQPELGFIAGDPAIIGLAAIRPELVDFEIIMMKE
ncbi:MAG: hypothetical protein OEV85_05985 [Candidatus Thorarchaeota archaeon]|nr:hypothetical protein [Candidatus Thorarchaeota archaeon]